METTEKTYTKLNLKPVKASIKAEVDKQKMLKDARKNATYTVEDNGRKIVWNPMHPSEAQSRAHFKSQDLRLLYAAYALLRGKTLKDAEYNYDENDPNHFLNCNKLKIGKILEAFKEMSEIKE